MFQHRIFYGVTLQVGFEAWRSGRTSDVATCTRHLGTPLSQCWTRSPWKPPLYWSGTRILCRQWRLTPTSCKLRFFFWRWFVQTVCDPPVVNDEKFSLLHWVKTIFGFLRASSLSWCYILKVGKYIRSLVASINATNIRYGMFDGMLLHHQWRTWRDCNLGRISSYNFHT